MQDLTIHEPVAVFLTIVSIILVAPLLSERVRLPGIVGLIVGGILVGPHGIGLLAANDTMELLSTVGLIYLMFSAGLELDLGQFSKVRNKAIVFGLLGFGIPQASGLLLGRFLDFDLRASILLGSIYASHTLIAFPLLNRLGIMKDEAVATTVTATVFTDVASLLVLAVIVGAEGGQGGQETGLFILQLVGLMIAYTMAVLLGLPRLGKRFFRHFSDRNVEFQFVLAALFVAAVGAELIGMHAIVGAFIAGLAINSTLPEHSPVAGRVLFVGESLFIPIFLIFVGMRIDPLAVVSSLDSMLTGALLIGAVLSTKFVASWLTSKVFAYGRNEMMTMWGLSQAQAAATLAALLVGIEAGVLPEWLFNAAILMVLATSISSPMIVGRFGRRLHPKAEDVEQQPIFARIMVPIANPETQENLIRLAATMALGHEGKLLPVHVATEVDGKVKGLENQDRLMDAVEEQMVELEVEAEPMRKVSRSVPRGIRQASVEGRASALLMGWEGATTFRQQIFGGVIDRVIWSVEIPVFVARVATSVLGIERVILLLPDNSVAASDATRVLEIATSLARGLQVPMMVHVGSVHMEAAKRTKDELEGELEVKVKALAGDVVAAVTGEDRAGAESLVVIVSSGSARRFRWTVGSIPDRLSRQIEDSVMVINFP